MKDGRLFKTLKNVSWRFVVLMMTAIANLIIPRYIILIYGSEVNGLTSSISHILMIVNLIQAGLGSSVTYLLYRPIEERDRVVLASFHEELYDEYQRLQASGEVPANFMYSPAYDAVTEFVVMQILKVDAFFDDGMCVFQLPMEEYGINLATKALVDTAHNHNLAIHYWTINDPEEMRYLIQIGADGIMTDYPHLLQEVYDSYND